MLLHPMAGCAAVEASPPPTIPTASQALRRRQPHTAAEPMNHHSPLRAGFHCRVVPFLGLAVIHRPGALGARGQHGQGTASIGRGLYVERLTAGSPAAARKCLHITCKIIIPPPDSGDPPDGPPYFAKKRSPRCQLGSTESATLLRTKNEYSPG